MHKSRSQAFFFFFNSTVLTDIEEKRVGSQMLEVNKIKLLKIVKNLTFLSSVKITLLRTYLLRRKSIYLEKQKYVGVLKLEANKMCCSTK